MTHQRHCPCNNADDRGCFLISASTNKCVSCQCIDIAAPSCGCRGCLVAFKEGLEAAEHLVRILIHPECLDEDSPQCDACPELLDRAAAIANLRKVVK